MATMLDCKKIQPLLSEYIDGGLAQENDWDVRLHVASCGVCSQIVEELSATVRLMSSLPAMETSAGFEDALARRLADKVLTPKRETFANRLRTWWEQPMVRPLVGSATAATVLAALIPIALVFTRPTIQAPAGNKVPSVASAAKSQGAEAGTIDLQQITDEHAFSAASETLGGRSGVLLANAQGDAQDKSDL